MNKYIKNVCSGILFLSLLGVIGVYVFYILYNAEWLIGDDAFMLRRTAFGIPFPISESVLPDWGFFRPFDYLHENLVLLFHSGMHSAFEHYIINAVSFLLCMSALFGILWKTIKPKTAVDYAIIVLGVILVASRLIGVYINIFGPIFGVYTYHMLAIFFMLLFYDNDKLWAMLLSLWCWIYAMLIYENVCLSLLTTGCVTLVFAYKRLTPRYRAYCFSLIGLVIAFFVAYLVFIVMPSSGEHYDPAHGSEVSLLENAMNMLLGQKFILLAAVVWLWRQIVIVKGKSQYHVVYDSLLWTAGAVVCGALVLRLNWTMYYYDAILFAVPAVIYLVYNSNARYGKYVALGIVLLFAIIYSVRVPRYIRENQEDRINTSQEMTYIANKIREGASVSWYEAKEDYQGYDVSLVSWKRVSTMNYIQYLLADKNWQFCEFDHNTSILFYTKENDKYGGLPDELKGYKRVPAGKSGREAVSYIEILHHE